jgi:hypothetical protein
VSGALSTILENRGEQWVSFSAFGLGVLNFKKKDIIEFAGFDGIGSLCEGVSGSELP